MKIIFDTDIGWMNDDALAALFALNAPWIDVLGVTTVMGNHDLSYSTAAALRLLELTGRADIPVCAGFDRPLLHERSAYADGVWGEWATFPETITLPEGLPAAKADPRHAVDFIIETVTAHPGEVTLVGLGPLTNIAIALRKAPQIRPLIREIVIMGGGLSLFPDGWGNSTPTAEFNFWVDPEAARMVLRSGLPIRLAPINVCRRTRVTRAFVERLARAPEQRRGVAALFAKYLLPKFETPEGLHHLAYGLYDSVVIAWLLDPSLFRTRQLSIDIVADRSASYGMSIGYEAAAGSHAHDNMAFALADAPPPVTVACEMDFDGFCELYLKTVGGSA